MRGFMLIVAMAAMALPALAVTPALAESRGDNNGGDNNCFYVVQPPFAANLRVRSGPGEGFPAIDSLSYQGTAQGPCENRGNWTRVWGDHGAEGWAFGPYLQEE